MRELSKLLGPSSLVGIFGAGHLGRAFANGLLAARLPKSQLAVCSRGSVETIAILRDEGLADISLSPGTLCSRSKILLYMVRPRDFGAIEQYALRDDCLLISSLGGISLEQLPVALPHDQRVRIMPSAPDTMRNGRGIAAVFPSGNECVKEILAALSLQEVALDREADIHAFTGLALCLPIALTLGDAVGREFDETEYVETALRLGLPDPLGNVKWARAVQQRDLSIEPMVLVQSEN